MNPHKNMQVKSVWFKTVPDEYKQLIDALDTNDKEKVLDIIFEIYLRGDLK